ncbi:MAG: hypothetical protein ABR915_03780 [Thermoguttaceae bacterium]
MPLHRFLFLAPLVLAGLIAPAAAFAAAGKVQLEIVGASEAGTALALQDWLKALRSAGIENVRLRTAQDAAAPGIEVRGTEENPVYVVTGVLTGGDEVLLPGARFRRTEAKRLAAWLADLAERGPPDRRPPPGPLGLSAKQFHEVHDDLARPLGFSTRGITRAEAVQKIASRLRLALRIEGPLADGDDKIEEELSGLSSGTALACILRPIGFAMVPRAGGGAVTYAVAKAQLDREVWPIGWPPDKPQNEVLPALFEFRNVNVQNVSASQVMDAIGRQIKVPILLDHNAMARHGVDPAKASVSLPQQRTNYSLALGKLLFQARLKFEIRVDEAGTPFLWVSTVKPV